MKDHQANTDSHENITISFQRRSLQVQLKILNLLPETQITRNSNNSVKNEKKENRSNENLFKPSLLFIFKSCFNQEYVNNTVKGINKVSIRLQPASIISVYHNKFRLTLFIKERNLNNYNSGDVQDNEWRYFQNFFLIYISELQCSLLDWKASIQRTGMQNSKNLLVCHCLRRTMKKHLNSWLTLYWLNGLKIFLLFILLVRMYAMREDHTYIR